MPFAADASLLKADLDNMLRGLHRDNADSALTGTATETALKTFNVAGGTIGTTGGLLVLIAGTLTGTTDTKTLRLKYGTTTLATITQTAGTATDWYFMAWVFNTSATAQRWFILRNGDDLLTSTFDYTTSAEDSSAALDLEVTGQLGGTTDTITKTMFDVFVVQVQ